MKGKGLENTRSRNVLATTGNVRLNVRGPNWLEIKDFPVNIDQIRRNQEDNLHQEVSSQRLYRHGGESCFVNGVVTSWCG